LQGKRGMLIVETRELADEIQAEYPHVKIRVTIESRSLLTMRRAFQMPGVERLDPRTEGLEDFW
jgi:hypothetical protein